MKSATIKSVNLSPYGIGETVEIVFASYWDSLEREVLDILDAYAAWGRVNISYTNDNGDPVNINDYI